MLTYLFSKASQLILLPSLGKFPTFDTAIPYVTHKPAHCIPAYMFALSGLYGLNGIKCKSSQLLHNCQYLHIVFSIARGLHFISEKILFHYDRHLVAFIVEVWPSQSAFLMSTLTMPWLDTNKTTFQYLVLLMEQNTEMCPFLNLPL